ncbi:Hypothetical_protein [Hexamita inflata]|uniref:Hypothetical_protein n=1 Tax=Hexamita inflata TaxID=28002 RepID=A0AA86UBF0_9EUKA|nr:Hypothetical protein HINF_LOCUS38775 [Hexamita inflata]
MYKDITAEISQMQRQIITGNNDQLKAKVSEFRSQRQQNQFLLQQQLAEKNKYAKEQNVKTNHNSLQLKQLIDNNQKEITLKHIEAKRAQTSPKRDFIDAEKQRTYKEYNEKVGEIAVLKQQREEEEQRKAAERREMIKLQEKSVKQQNIIVKITKKLEYQEYQNQRKEIMEQRAEAAKKESQINKMRQQQIANDMKAMQKVIQLKNLGK